MTERLDSILPYLFGMVSAFIFLNGLISVILYKITYKNDPVFKLLGVFWGLLLVSFNVAGLFQKGSLEVILSFGLMIFPTLVVAKVALLSVGRELAWKKYLGIFLIGLIVSAAITPLDPPFLWHALPLCLAMTPSMIESTHLLLFSKKTESTLLQKLLGVFFLLGTLHVFNFAFFRMDPGAQFFGWGATFILYQVSGIILPAFALEIRKKGEQRKLERLVAEKTQALAGALKDKDRLLRVLLHDISTPLCAQFNYIQTVADSPSTDESSKELLGHSIKCSETVQDIIENIRQFEYIKSGKVKLKLRPVNPSRCFDTISSVFQGRARQKGIDLKIENHLSKDTRFLAEESSFTTSVLSNLISNALKFSDADSDLEVITREDQDNVIFEINDKGLGIPKEMQETLFDVTRSISRRGTNGEQGTGFGLSLAKSYVESYGGRLEIDSRCKQEFPLNHGTSVRVYLEKATSTHLQ